MDTLWQIALVVMALAAITSIVVMLARRGRGSDPFAPYRPGGALYDPANDPRRERRARGASASGAEPAAYGGDPAAYGGGPAAYGDGPATVTGAAAFAGPAGHGPARPAGPARPGSFAHVSFPLADRGYDPAAVDDLIDRAEATLLGAATGRDRVSAHDAASAEFPVARGGYDPREVDAWIRGTLVPALRDLETKG